MEHIWVSPNKVDEPRAYYTEWSESESEKNKYHILTPIYGIQKGGTDEPICRAETETQTENRLMDMDGWGRKERVRLMKRVDGSIHYQM